MVGSLKNNLLTVIKTFAANNQKRVVLDNLCIGMSYIILHTHQIWPTIIEEIIV